MENKLNAKTNFRVTSLGPRQFEIKEDPSVGFYLYVFENNRCICDYLQDTLEIAMEFAWEEYGVPKNAWKKKKLA